MKTLKVPYPLKFLFLVMTFGSLIYFTIDFFYNRGIVDGNDLVAYAKVFEHFKIYGFDFGYILGATGSTEPLFWVTFLASSLIADSPEEAFTLVTLSYLIYTLALTPSDLRLRILVFLITISLTFTFSNALGNTLRSYCSVMLLTCLFFRESNSSGKSSHFFSFLLLMLIFLTHYGAGIIGLLVFLFSRRMSKKFYAVLLTLVGCVMFFGATMYLDNVMYKILVYTSSNGALGKNYLLIYMVLLSGVAVFWGGKLNTISKEYILIFAVFIAFSYLYYIANFNGMSRVSLFCLLWIYIKIFHQIEGYIRYLPILWFIMPLYLALRFQI